MLSMPGSLPNLQCENEEVSAMTRVLVGVEMLQCNRNPRHMEFSVPSLSTVCTFLFMFPTVAVAQMATTDANMTHEPSDPVCVSSCVSIFKYCSCFDHHVLLRLRLLEIYLT